MDDHLLPLPVATAITCNTTHDLSSSDESDVEVRSNFDEDINELIDMSTYLRFDTMGDGEDDGESGNEEFARPDPHALPQSLVSYSMTSSDDDDLCVTSCSDLPPVSSSSLLADSGTSSVMQTTTTELHSSQVKRKRRQWSVTEKLYAVKMYEKCKSKHNTATQIGCTRFQLTSWITNHEELLKLSAQQKGEHHWQIEYGHVDGHLCN